jgi:hypothetical protein
MAGEPGGAEGDEGHWTIRGDGGDVRRSPAVYRRPGVWQAVNAGLSSGLVPEPAGWPNRREWSTGVLPVAPLSI